ncbi:MAG TPA: AAA family ATPase [Acidimicrobiales bacterium]|jgi:class 3 adenylate cyclase
MLAGRTNAQVLLDRWLTEVGDGQPRFALICGDPGIGKSRLLHHWAAKVRDTETRVLIGSAFENVSTPFLPVATAVEALPGLSDVFADPPAGTGGDNAAMRVHLSVAGGLVRAATHRPVVLAIDDVHWADPGTLGFLHNLLAMLSQPPSGMPVRMFVVATSRAVVDDPDVDIALGRLGREPIARRLSLGGLDELEMHQLLTDRCQAFPSPAFLSAVLEATSGNPLLAELIVEQLELHGGLRFRQGHVFADPGAVQVTLSPELGQACAPRLGRVDPETRDVLEVAALVGDGGSLDDLAAIAGIDQDEVLRLLAVAEDAAVAQAEGPAYRFRHPLLRSVLVGSLSRHRRLAVERRIVDGLLARHGTTDDRVALTIVEHARRSGRPLRAPVTAELLDGAGRYATSLGAWAAAAECYEQRLDALAGAGAAERARAEFSAGSAHRRNADYQAAHPHLLRAVELASAGDDVETWGEALYWLTNSQVLERVPDARVDPSVVECFLDRAGDAVPDARAKVLGNLAQFHFSQFDLASALPVLARAKDAARQAERTGTHHFLATVEGLHHLGGLDLPQAEDCFRTAMALAPDHEDPWQAVFIEVGLPLVDLLAGELTRATAEAAAAARSALGTNQWNLHGLATACSAAAAVGQGRVGDAERHATAALQSFRRSDYYWAAVVGVPSLAAARAFRGDRLGALRALDEWTDREDHQIARDVLRVEMLCGDPAQAAAVADGARLLPFGPTTTLFSLNHALLAVEAGDRLDDLAVLEAGYGYLASVPGDVSFGVDWCIGIRRVLGLGALRLGDAGAARAWLDQARQDALIAASPAEQARIEVVEARLLAQAGADGAAIRQALRPALDFAADARLLALAAEARRAWPGHRPDLRRDLVVLYTDIVGSTELNVRAGDDMYLELLREHNTIVRRRLAAYGGIEFTFTGDGVGASFASTDRALAFALGLQADFDEANDAHPGFPLQVRIGLARGDALENEGNLFGQTVVRAVRVCAAAGAGEVLVDEDVPARVDPSVARFTTAGRVHLKGFGGAELYRARPLVAADY